MRVKAILAMLMEVTKMQLEEELYKTYTTNVLRLIGENVAKSTGGSYISSTYQELIHPKKQDERKADDIISSFKKRLNRQGGD